LYGHCATAGVNAGVMCRRCRRHVAAGPGVTVVLLVVLLSLSCCCRCHRRIGATAALTIVWSLLQPLLLVPSPLPSCAAGAAVAVGLPSLSLSLIVRAGGWGLALMYRACEKHEAGKKGKTYHMSELKSGASPAAFAMLLLVCHCDCLVGLQLSTIADPTLMPGRGLALMYRLHRT
jgi:hypothetical protein